MKERRKAKKQAMYARIAAIAVAAVARKGCAEGEDEEEEDEDEAQEAASEAPISTFSPEPRRRSLSPLQLPHWDISTPALGLELQLELGFDFPSPTESYTSTAAPLTPVTPSTPLIPPDSFHFPRTKPDVATTTEYPVPPPPPPPSPMHTGNHLRRDPRIARGRFRTLSASLTARSPLSLSFPLSFSLPLAMRRASSPCVVVAERESLSLRDEDPFGAHGSAYYAASLGLGDAYDLSAWAWACDFSPRRRVKKQRVRAATTGSGSGSATSVYSAPVHAASAPQLTLGCSGVIANACVGAGAGAGVDGERTPRAVRTPVPARGCEVAVGPRRGMRPLLLPQKLGLLTIGATSGWDQYEAERTDSWSSVRRESRVRGWDIDLERGV